MKPIFFVFCLHEIFTLENVNAQEILGQSVGKPRGYYVEWSPKGSSQKYSMESLGTFNLLPLESMSAKGTSREVPFTMIPRGFPTDSYSNLSTGPVVVHLTR